MCAQTLCLSPSLTTHFIPFPRYPTCSYLTREQIKSCLSTRKRLTGSCLLFSAWLVSRSLHAYFRAKTRECRPIFHKSLRIYSIYHLFSLFLRSVALSAAYIRRGMRYLVRCQNHSLYQLSEYLPDLSFSSPLAQTISKHLGAWSWINIGLSVTC